MSSWRTKINQFQREIVAFETIRRATGAFDASYVFVVGKEFQTNWELIAKKMVERFPLLSTRWCPNTNFTELESCNRPVDIESWFLNEEFVEDFRAYELLYKYPLDLFGEQFFKCGEIQTPKKKFAYFTVHHMMADGVTQAKMVEDFLSILGQPQKSRSSDLSFFGTAEEIQSQIESALSRLNLEKIKKDWESFDFTSELTQEPGQLPYFINVDLPEEFTSALMEHLVKESQSPNAFFSSLFSDSLFLECGGKEVYLQVTLSRRQALKNSVSFGHFVNLIPCRFERRSENLTVDQWVQANQRRILRYGGYASLPYEHLARIIGDRLKRQPLTITFNYAVLKDTASAPGLSYIPSQVVMPRNSLGVSADHLGRTISLSFRGDGEILSEQLAIRLFERWIVNICVYLQRSKEIETILKSIRVGRINSGKVKGNLKNTPQNSLGSGQLRDEDVSLMTAGRFNTQLELKAVLDKKIHELWPEANGIRDFPKLGSLQKILFLSRIAQLGIKINIPNLLTWNGELYKLRDAVSKTIPNNHSNFSRVYLFPDVTGSEACFGEKLFQSLSEFKCDVLRYTPNTDINAQSENFANYIATASLKAHAITLVGYSFGGIVAFETAIRLKKIGCLCRLVFIDCRPLLAPIPDEDFTATALDAWVELQDLHPKLRDSRRLYDEEIINRNLKLYLSYQPRGTARNLIHLRSMHSEQGKDGGQWRQFFDRTVEFYFDKNHYEMIRSPELCRKIAGLILTAEDLKDVYF